MNPLHRLLRWIASLIVRGPGAPFVVGDLEEAMRRDVARGVPPWRARMRYLSNLLLSASSLWRDEARRWMEDLPRPRISLLDLKLGVRMLVKYPGLTVVGGMAMAFAICVGAAGFEVFSQLVDPDLGFPGDERIVGIPLMDARTLAVEDRALFDFAVWREELESVEALGAFRTVGRTLVTAEGDAVGPPVTAAEISASGFLVAPVPPLMGRPLVPGDERPGAAPVAVIGYDVWRYRLGADPDVVGRVVQVGGRQTTIVGVMPEAFAFPENHGLWLPLGQEALHHAPGEGPAIRVFGRLAPGVTLKEAQSEAAAVGRRLAAAHPRTHEHLRPRIMPYPLAIAGFRAPEGLSYGLAALLIGSSFNLPLVLFVVLVCGNVALLLFARAATRERELLVRSALGASRGRIIAQLFAEALVLGTLAVVVGLSGANLGLRWLHETVGVDLGSLPYWFQPRLSLRTVAYALGLTLLAAVVTGVLPALKVTSGLGARLRGAMAGGARFRFGGIWTAVVVTQIALTVALPLVVVGVEEEARQVRATDLGFEASEYLSVRLVRGDPPTADLPADGRPAPWIRTRAAALEIERRLLREPAVRGVTFVQRVPWSHHPRSLIEVEGPSEAPRDHGGHRVATTTVETDYFDVLGVDVLQGRMFHAGDADGQGTVIVNQPFVDDILGGRNALGGRLRYPGAAAGRAPDREREPWLEIVGVVPDLGTRTAHRRAGIYHPAPAEGPPPAHMLVHVPGEADAFGPRLRALAAEVDPSLRLHDLLRVDRVADSTLRAYAFWSVLATVVTGVGLLLSLAGIYAVMAFTVSQRTREIGVRVALGAEAARVVTEIFRDPLRQLALGVASGGGLIATAWLTWVKQAPSPARIGQFLVYLAFAAAVYLLACVVPTLRALRVQPSEALRADE